MPPHCLSQQRRCTVGFRFFYSARNRLTFKTVLSLLFCANSGIKHFFVCLVHFHICDAVCIKIINSNETEQTWTLKIAKLSRLLVFATQSVWNCQPRRKQASLDRQNGQTLELSFFVWSTCIYDTLRLKCSIALQRSKPGPSKWLNSGVKFFFFFFVICLVQLYLGHGLFEMVNKNETKQTWTFKVAKLWSTAILFVWRQEKD